MKQKFIYVWFDADENPRSKVRYCEEATIWNYDGSSTGQATTESSEVLLVPIKKYLSPPEHQTYVLCNISTDNAYTLISSPEVQERLKTIGLRMAFEQEFTIFDAKTAKPYKYDEWATASQGQFYCSVGATGNGFIERYVEEAFDYAVQIGVNVTGYNLEVAPAQGEIQVDSDAINAAHDLMMLRFILWKILAKYDLYPVYHPKPYGSQWNGSGLHTNVSTHDTMGSNGINVMYDMLKRIEAEHAKWMPYLGKGNEERLTGIHETSALNRFTVGVASRATSVRIPTTTVSNGYGYFEDRRPAANANPYMIVYLYTFVV